MLRMPTLEMHYLVFRLVAEKFDWNRAEARLWQYYCEEQDRLENVRIRAVLVSQLVDTQSIHVWNIPREDPDSSVEAWIHRPEKVMCVENLSGNYSFLSKFLWDSSVGPRMH